MTFLISVVKIIISYNSMHSFYYKGVLFITYNPDNIYKLHVWGVFNLGSTCTIHIRDRLEYLIQFGRLRFYLTSSLSLKSMVTAWCMNIHLYLGCTINHPHGSKLNVIRINIIMYSLVVQITPKLCLGLQEKIAQKIFMGNSHTLKQYISNVYKAYKDSC